MAQNLGSSDPGKRRLQRSSHERLLFGVCGGVAEYLGYDPTLVRIGFALAALIPPLSPVALGGYIVLAFIMPTENVAELPARDRVVGNFQSLRDEATELTETVRGRLSSITGRSMGTTSTTADTTMSGSSMPGTNGASHSTSEAETRTPIVR